MSNRQHRVAERSYCLASLFEAELLTRLMLWRWNHPLADDDDFVNHLVEGATEVLRACVQENRRFLNDVDPGDMNFVAAVWYVEWAATSDSSDADAEEERRVWLDRVRRALPSCFCDPTDLP